MVDYAKLAATAKNMLTNNGQSVTVRTYTVGSYDPDSGTSTNTYTDSTRKGVLLDYGSGLTQVRGNLVETTDKKLLVDSDAAISQQDHVLINSVEYSIVSIGEINPAGTAVIYDLHIRK